jgi:hypothetical protein
MLNLVAVALYMDLRIGGEVDHKNSDPLTGLVRLDQCPIGVHNKGAQGLSKFLVPVGDDTCVLLLKGTHDAYEIRFQVTIPGNWEASGLMQPHTTY